MSTLRNHPGFWMRDDAEASLARWEADHGVIGVNSAGRYEWEQQELINRWNQGGTYNRPPYLYGPKRPASASSHVANGGIAFDTSEYVRFRRTCADYGWWQPYDWDVVHFEYNPSRDKHRNRPAGESTPKEEDPMPKHESKENSTRQVLKPGWNVREITPKQLYLADYSAGGGEIGEVVVFVEAENVAVGGAIQAQLVFEEMKGGKVTSTRTQPVVEIPGTTGVTFGQYVMPYNFANGRMFLRLSVTDDPHGKAVIKRTTVKKNYWTR